jgi:integrase
MEGSCSPLLIELSAEFEGLADSEPVWRVPGERMKVKREHLVPLSRQAVEVINTVRPLTGRGRLCSQTPATHIGR